MRRRTFTLCLFAVCGLTAEDASNSQCTAGNEAQALLTRVSGFILGDPVPNCVRGLKAETEEVTLDYSVGSMDDYITHTDMEASWRRFESLLNEQGVISAVSIASCGSGLRGLRATRAVKAGEVLISVPKALLLASHYADTSPVRGLWEKVGELPSHLTKLALLLVHELRGGKNAALAPFIQLLPTPGEMQAQGGPAWTWSAAELAVTECPKLVADAMAKHEVLKETLLFTPEVLHPRWTAQGLPGPPPTQTELEWAIAVVTTRWSTDRARMVEGPHLPPMADMANHAAQPNADSGHGANGNYVLVASSDLRDEEQACSPRQLSTRPGRIELVPDPLSSEPVSEPVIPP